MGDCLDLVLGCVWVGVGGGLGFGWLAVYCRFVGCLDFCFLVGLI